MCSMCWTISKKWVLISRWKIQWRTQILLRKYIYIDRHKQWINFNICKQEMKIFSTAILFISSAQHSAIFLGIAIFSPWWIKNLYYILKVNWNHETIGNSTQEKTLFNDVTKSKSRTSSRSILLMQNKAKWDFVRGHFLKYYTLIDCNSSLVCIVIKQRPEYHTDHCCESNFLEFQLSTTPMKLVCIAKCNFLPMSYYFPGNQKHRYWP